MIIPKDKNGDLSIPFLWSQKLVKEMRLVDMTQSKTPLQFRFWTTRQIIEVWRNNDSSIAGQIITYTRDVDQFGGPKKKSKIHSNTEKLSAAMASNIFSWVDSSNVRNLKTADSIPQWQLGSDGYFYIIEDATKTKYEFKYYWGCSYQDSTILEAVTLESFFQ